MEYYADVDVLKNGFIVLLSANVYSFVLKDISQCNINLYKRHLLLEIFNEKVRKMLCFFDSIHI